MSIVCMCVSVCFKVQECETRHTHPTPTPLAASYAAETNRRGTDEQKDAHTETQEVTQWVK